MTRMRLLNAKSKKLELIPNCERPPYAIVSHRWGADSDEVLFTNFDNMPSPLARIKVMRNKKVAGACSQALRDGYKHVWLDTCCIDRENQTELTASLNSMYRWYQESAVCYVYLRDVSDISQITESEWFRRGWTLQELIAPRVVRFFSKDWKLLATREGLIQKIGNRTGIDSRVLQSHGTIPNHVTIAQRMRWATGRNTKEEEDTAYSLMGLFDRVHLHAIYGIKEEAFMKLQYEIMSKSSDQSLFAWVGEVGITRFLAASPSHYLNVYEIPCEEFYSQFPPSRLSRWPWFSPTNGAVRLCLPIRQIEDHSTSVYEALLRCSLDPPQPLPQHQRPLVVRLRYDNTRFRFIRVHGQTSISPLKDNSVASFTLQEVLVDEV